MIKSNLHFSNLSSLWASEQMTSEHSIQKEIFIKTNSHLDNVSAWIETARDNYGLSGFMLVLDHLLNDKYNFYQSKGLETFLAQLFQTQAILNEVATLNLTHKQKEEERKQLRKKQKRLI